MPKGQLIKVIGVGFVRVPQGSSKEVIQQAANAMLKQQEGLADVQEGRVDLEGNVVPEDNSTTPEEAQFTDEKEQLAFDEGRRTKVYKDTEGHLTAGIGHKLTKQELKKYDLGDEVPDDLIDTWFDKDYADAQRGVDRIIKSRKMENVPEEVHSILTNMVFNMGVKGVKEFKDTLSLIEQGEWAMASEEMLESKWAEEQVGPRAKRLSDRMAKVKTEAVQTAEVEENVPQTSSQELSEDPFEIPTPDLQQSLEQQNNVEPANIPPQAKAVQADTELEITDETKLPPGDYQRDNGEFFTVTQKSEVINYG